MLTIYDCYLRHAESRQQCHYSHGRGELCLNDEDDHAIQQMRSHHRDQNLNDRRNVKKKPTGRSIGIATDPRDTDLNHLITAIRQHSHSPLARSDLLASFSSNISHKPTKHEPSRYDQKRFHKDVRCVLSTGTGNRGVRLLKWHKSCGFSPSKLRGCQTLQGPSK